MARRMVNNVLSMEAGVHGSPAETLYVGMIAFKQARGRPIEAMRVN
jgi:hypothetical protein